MAEFDEFSVTIPSDTSVAQKIQERIVGSLESLNFTSRDVFSVRLALEEALTNAIRHGNKLDPEKVVEVDCRINSDRLHISIRDQGPGFSPNDVPDPTAPENLERPSGRGLMLMRTYMDLVEYSDTGNQVTLEKKRTVETE